MVGNILDHFIFENQKTFLDFEEKEKKRKEIEISSKNPKNTNSSKNGKKTEKKIKKKIKKLKDYDSSHLPLHLRKIIEEELDTEIVSEMKKINEYIMKYLDEIEGVIKVNEKSKTLLQPIRNKIPFNLIRITFDDKIMQMDRLTNYLISHKHLN